MNKSIEAIMALPKGRGQFQREAVLAALRVTGKEYFTVFDIAQMSRRLGYRGFKIANDLEKLGDILWQSDKKAFKLA